MVIIAERSHLFPFRTQKLSSPAPKVLVGSLTGRIGRRHFPFIGHPFFADALCFAFVGFSRLYRLRCVRSGRFFAPDLLRLGARLFPVRRGHGRRHLRVGRFGFRHGGDRRRCGAGGNIFSPQGDFSLFIPSFCFFPKNRGHGRVYSIG